MGFREDEDGFWEPCWWKGPHCCDSVEGLGKLTEYGAERDAV